MTLSEEFASISYRFLQPASKLRWPFSSVCTHAFWLPQYVWDRWSTVIPFLDYSRKQALLRTSAMRKMSTLSIGAIISECVRRMPDDACYLNIGTWHGFSLFAGMVGNPEKSCIGVDSFVQFGAPRTSFFRRFQKYRSSRHEFYDADWRIYMRGHTRNIGVFLYDAAHDESSQFDAVMLADPFIISGGIIIVDDTNWSGPRDAIMAFLRQKKNYRILFDQPTASNCHPTLWNGIMVLQKCS